MPLLATLVAVLLAACASDPAPQAPEPCADCAPPLPDCAGSARTDLVSGVCAAAGRTGACPAGFVADARLGCTEVLPPAACPPGSLESLGSTGCAPVGVPSCAPPFSRTLGGWTCSAALPPSPCAAGSMERLGYATCSKFPGCPDPLPANADVVVNPAFTAAELDARHVRTLAEAVAAAPKGGTIAVEGGVYREDVTLDRDVTLVGRCAQQVRLEGTSAVPVLTVRAVAHVSRVAIAGGGTGVAVEAGALTFVDGEISNATSAGIRVAPKSRLTLTRAAVRLTTPKVGGAAVSGLRAGDCDAITVEDSVFASNSDAALTITGACALRLTRSIVRDTVRRTAKTAPGVVLQGPASAVVEDSVLHANCGSALSARAGARVEVRRTSFADTRVCADAGLAVQATGGAQVLLEDVSASGNLTGVVRAEDPATAVTVRRSALEGSLSCPVGLPSGACRGLYAHVGARLDVADSALLALAGTAVLLDDAAEATLSQVLVEDTLPTELEGTDVYAGTGAALHAQGLVSRRAPQHAVQLAGAGSRATLEAALLEDCGGGRLLPASALRVGTGATATLDGSLVRGMSGPALAVDGRDGPASLTVTQSLVRDGRSLFQGDEGIGLVVFGAGGAATIRDSTFSRCSAAAVLAYEGAATLERVSLLDSLPDRKGQSGVGIVGSLGVRLTLRDVALRDMTSVALSVAEASRLEADELLVAGVRPQVALPLYGYGLLVSGGAQAKVADVEVRDAQAVGVACVGGSASMSRAVVRRNGVGLFAPDARVVEGEALEAGALAVGPGSVVRDNAMAVSGGDLPLPPAPEWSR